MLLVLLISALWGGTPVAISYSVASLPPVCVAAIRFALAAVFMLFWCRVEGSSLLLRREQLGLVLIAAVLLFFQIASFNIGTSWSNSSHSSMLVNTFVFGVVALEHFITKTDRLTSRKLIGLVLATAGVVVVLSVSNPKDSASIKLDLPTLSGDCVLLVSAALLSVRIVFTKHAVKRIEPGKFIFWHDVVAVGLFAGYSAVAEQRPELTGVSTPAMLGLLYQGVLVAGLCFAVQANLLKSYSASRISVFSFATPLFGVLFAVVFRNDPLSPWLMLSAACVAAGIFVVNWSK